MNPTLGKAIAIGTTAVGATLPLNSLYTSGQENRGAINTTLHMVGAGAIGAGISFGGSAISGTNILQIASKIAK